MVAMPPQHSGFVRGTTVTPRRLSEMLLGKLGARLMCDFMVVALCSPMFFIAHCSMQQLDAEFI